MKRRLTAAVLLCICLALRAGRELEGVELIQTLGIDRAEDTGGILLAAATDGGEGEVFRAAGADVILAQENLRWVGTRRLELTHVTHLVLGADAPLAEVLEQEVTHRKSGYGARVWLAEGSSAGELLEAGDDPTGRLGSLEQNAGVEAPTILEALSRLREEGEVRLPNLRLGEDGELTFAGYETRREARR